MARRSVVTRVSLGPRKVVTTVFFGYKRVIFVDMSRGKTINPNLYLKIIKTLQKRFGRVLSQNKVLQYSTTKIHQFENTGNNYKRRLDCCSPTTILPRFYSLRSPTI
jgi:hypothetical protein